MAKLNKYLKSPSLSLVLRHRVKELGTNPLRVSASLQLAYDHIRKIHNGEVFPGARTLRKICDELKLDFEEMQQLVNKDKALEKGWVPIEITDHDPLLIKVGRNWSHLSENDKLEIIDLVTVKAERALNRATV